MHQLELIYESFEWVLNIHIAHLLSCVALDIAYTISNTQGTWYRGERPRVRAQGSMFDSLLRLQYSRPFHFDA